MNIFQKYQIYFTFIILMVVTSCGKDSSCFKGTGDIAQEQRVVSKDVSSIITEDNIDIVITQSSEPSMTVEGGENLLPYINTDVSGTVLSISSDNKCGMFRDNTTPITVYLSIPNLINIDYTGQGNISSTNTLNFPLFNIESRSGTGSINLDVNIEELAIKEHSGPADFTFTGNVNRLYVYTLGQGWFYLDGLVSNSAHINHSGLGDIFVNVKNELSVEMRSIGSVYYLGSPAVEVSPNIGTGSVSPK
ncbi:MAG: head GIN domain-containing protein [Flavobacteriales bacterium]|jgi:hypothetical protein|tara:strand:- start:4968 stop:5711 length:744 start_codon:yes stop_codon:yes gene_type:complete